MRLSHTERIDLVIRDLCQFSSLDMFGHLFEVHPMQLEMLRTAEKHCGIILNAQLRRDLLSAGDTRQVAELTMARIQLEEKLAVLFNSNSSFWEQYYIRQSARPNEEPEAPTPYPLMAENLQNIARTHYPALYVILDALHFSSDQRTREYPLIQMSLQSYLKGMLQSLSDPEGATLAFAQAIKLLGPVNAPRYRELIIQKLAS